MTEVDALGAYTPTEKMNDEIPETELWSLDATLTAYILPRIKAFRKMERHGYPVNPDNAPENEVEEHRAMAEWENNLLDIENAFQLLKNVDYDPLLRSSANKAIIEKGLKKFVKYYEHLWD